MLGILFLCVVTIQLTILDCTFSLKTLFCNTAFAVMYIYMLFLVCHVHDLREKTFCLSVLYCLNQNKNGHVCLKMLHMATFLENIIYSFYLHCAHSGVERLLLPASSFSPAAVIRNAKI